MKKIIFAILAFLLLFLIACSDSDNTWDDYKEWREVNNDWLATEQARTEANGESFYKTVTAPWNPKGYVLIHYFNDRKETEGNLSPIYTSTVDVRYRGQFYNATPFDSSSLNTKYGPGVARFSLSGVIQGWALALGDMRVGDTAQIIVPYTLGYGTSYSGTIPPYSNLQFNVRLVDIPDYEKRP